MRGHWLREALDREPASPEPLRGDLTTDVCVVGGGYTGLWTALRLKELEPAIDVTVIERGICGGGASGRNGGFVMTWSYKVPSLLRVCGAQETVRLFQESRRAVRAIGAFCAEHGIDAGFRRDGWLWTATGPAQLDSWRDAIDALDRLGLHPFEELPPGEVARRTGSERHVAGVYERCAATVQPAVLARGLRRVCTQRGVRVHEGTPMTALERGGGRPAVRTPGGTVRADRVVLALNAWAHELPEFRRAVLAVGSDVIVTEPIPERLAELGLTDGVAISDSRFRVDYYRTTVDGRLAYGKGAGSLTFGGRVGDRFDTMADAEEVRAAMLRTYPGLAEVAIAAAWRGPVGRPAGGLPLFGRLPGAPAVVYGHGYAGNGVGPSWIGGRILASLALERRDAWSTCPLVNAAGPLYPPEPIRFLGGRVVRAAIRRKEDAEDQGRRPNPLDSFLAGLVPST